MIPNFSIYFLLNKDLDSALLKISEYSNIDPNSDKPVINNDSMILELFNHFD